MHCKRNKCDTISKLFIKYVDSILCNHDIKELQKSAVLDIARTHARAHTLSLSLRKVVMLTCAVTLHVLCIVAKEKLQHYTGLFISPSGISELDCATTKTHDRKEHINR